MKKCYNKILSESTSPEGLDFMKRHKEIPFEKCKKCDGLKNYSQCGFYVVRDLTFARRLENLGEDPPLNYLDDRFKTYSGGFGN